MATNVVNLDAMIPRQDMAEASDSAGSKLERIDIHHLDEHIFVGALRKPDFQRETAHWSPEKVADLIQAFVDGDPESVAPACACACLRACVDAAASPCEWSCPWSRLR